MATIIEDLEYITRQLGECLSLGDPLDETYIRMLKRDKESLETQLWEKENAFW